MNNESIKFSVVMPSYKLEGSFIERAIDSVLAQEYENWELLYVDDNSAGSEYKEISKRISLTYRNDERIHFIFHEDNLGANRARNDAINAATGEWLAMLDADDYWDSIYLSNVAKKIASMDCALVATSMRINNGHGWRDYPRTHEEGMVYEDAIMQNFSGGSSGACVRRDVLLEIGGFDDTLPACQDYDMFLRVCKKYPVGFCREIAVNYSEEEHERITKSIDKRVAGSLAVLDKTMADEDLSMELRQEAYSRWHRRIGRMYIVSAGNGKEARKHLRLASGLKTAILYAASFIAPIGPYAFEVYNRIRFK